MASKSKIDIPKPAARTPVDPAPSPVLTPGIQQQGSQTVQNTLNGAGVNTNISNPVGDLTSKAAGAKTEGDKSCPDSGITVQTKNKNTPPGWTGDGFTIKEINPPRPTAKAGVNAVPAKGTPTTPTPHKDVRCGNLLDKPIIFKCSVFAQIKMDSCLFQLEKVFKAFIESQIK